MGDSKGELSKTQLWGTAPHPANPSQYGLGEHFYLQCASAVNGGCPAAWDVDTLSTHPTHIHHCGNRIPWVLLARPLLGNASAQRGKGKCM